MHFFHYFVDIFKHYNEYFYKEMLKSEIDSNIRKWFKEREYCEKYG